MPCGCVYTSSPRYALSRRVIGCAKGVVYHISAWASALLVLAVMGNAKASSCGTGDGTATHAFSFTALHVFLFYHHLGSG